MLNEGNQIHNFISSSGYGTVINYGSSSDFFTSYGSGSGSTSKKVTDPTVPVPQRCLFQTGHSLFRQVSLIFARSVSFQTGQSHFRQVSLISDRSVSFQTGQSHFQQVRLISDRSVLFQTGHSHFRQVSLIWARSVSFQTGQSHIRQVSLIQKRFFTHFFQICKSWKCMDTYGLQIRIETEFISRIRSMPPVRHQAVCNNMANVLMSFLLQAGWGCGLVGRSSA